MRPISMWISTETDHQEVRLSSELRAVVRRLGTNHQFVIVRAEQPSEGAQCQLGPVRFAQASVFIGDDGSTQQGRFVVEYHEPDGSHFQAHSVCVEDIVEVLSRWAFGPAGWEHLLRFAPLRLR